MAIHSKNKGKRFEREIANDLKDFEIDKYSRRSIMSGAAFEAGDIKNKYFAIECKHRKSINI